jgi:AcrR family transcriptional regulator
VSSRVLAVASPPRPRSTRDRPAKPPLSEEAILDVALRIVRAEGLEAVTMRRLAAELDTGPASLYVYFKGREELRNGMLDRVAGSVALESPEPARWRDQVHRLLRSLLAAMEAHPGIANVAVANPPIGEATLLVAENLLALLLAGGVRPQDAAWSCDILPLITTASAVETAAYQERGLDTTAHETQIVDQLTDVFSTLSAARFPNITTHIAELTSGDGAQRFDFAVDVILDGLMARAARG